MAILDIYSENLDLSWIIFKNPETQKNQNKSFSRPLRKGLVDAWYLNNKEFRLFFSDNENSFYKNTKNNYLNQGNYNCPYVYCSMLSEMLKSTMNKKQEKDIDCYNKITIQSCLLTLPKISDSFEHFFKDKVTIKKHLLAYKSYKIEFFGNVSLYYLLNLVQVFCLIQSLEDKNIYIDLSSGALEKYANNLKVIKAPYFITYLFISRCLTDPKEFQKVKNILEQDGWKLNFGNTQVQRFREIKKFIQGGDTLHDIGCGELYYSRHFSTLYNKIYAWDADANIQNRNIRFLEKNNINNIILKNEFNVNSLDTILPKDDLLITEMLEHMPKEKALEVLREISKKQWRRLIITLPNKSFNKNYQMNQEFRHDDHYWEPSYEDAVNFIEFVFKEKYDIICNRIGDTVDSESVSTLFVIEKKV